MKPRLLAALILAAVLPMAPALAESASDTAPPAAVPAPEPGVVPVVINAAPAEAPAAVMAPIDADAAAGQAPATFQHMNPAQMSPAKPAAPAADPADVPSGSLSAPSGTADTAAATGATAVEERVEKPVPPPAPTLHIDINLSTQRLTVTENGAARFTWPISSGRSGYRTPTGTFKPQWMSRMWYSRQYDYSPMPHSIFFSGGVAIHATYATRMLGRPASHGCVRLAPSNAATLYKLVGKHGKHMTRIVVHGAPRFNEPRIASKKKRQRYADATRYRYSPYGGNGYGSGYSVPRAYYVKPKRSPRRGYYSGYAYGY